MAVHASHAQLPYPIKNARFSLLIPYLDADGDPTAPTTPDTEISKDNAAATDCAEEVSPTSGMDGMGLLTLTGAETDCATVALNGKVASGPKATLATLYPRTLASIGTGTLSAGSAGGGTLGALLAYDVTGCFIKTTGGTGGGGTGGANNQVRKIDTYNTGTGAFTVIPNWETTPSTDTTYAVLLPEGVTLGMLRTLNPTTPGNTITVSGGAVSTVTTLTNLPSITAGWLTATGIAASALNGKGDWNIGKTGYALSTAGVQAIWDALTSALTTVGSIGKLLVDKLGSITGQVASQAEVLSIQNNTRVIRSVPQVIERPDAGSETLRIDLYLYDDVGNMEAPDSAPTVSLTDNAGTDLSSRLDSTTMSFVSTGKYRVLYTNSSTDDLEQLKWEFTVIEGGETRLYGNDSLIVDTTAVDFTSSDRTALNDIAAKAAQMTFTNTNILDVCLANGVTHGGATAMLRLGASGVTPAFYVTNSGGHAGKFEATGGNNIALDLLGFGAGPGLRSAGGVTAAGAAFIGGATSGSGATFTAFGNGHGITASTGGAAWSGIAAVGGSAGNGILASGGTTGNGIRAIGGSVSGHAFVMFTTDGNGFEFDVSGAGKVSINAPDGIVGNLTGNVTGDWTGNLATNQATIIAAVGALPTAAANADAVWEEILADHSGTAGSTAAALNAAGSAGDPWNTQLPGAYPAGSAGKIIGDNLNATVSSRASQTSVDSVASAVASVASGVATAITAISATATQVSVDSLLSSAHLNKVADHLYRRNLANVKVSTDGDAIQKYSLYGFALQAMHSNTTTNPGFLTVFDTDDAEFFQTALTTSATAEPVTGVGGA